MLDTYNIICPCGYQDPHKNTKLIIQCASCKTYQHKYCMKSMVKMTGYQCPYCQLKKGALFFNTLYLLSNILEINSFRVVLPFEPVIAIKGISYLPR